MKNAVEQKGLRIPLVLGCLVFFVLCGMILNIACGSVAISPGEIPKILFARGGSQVEQNILFQIRLPRLLLAAFCGGALAVSGFLLQTFFMNPVAGPFVLGISSGAKMAVAGTMILVTARTGRSSSTLSVIAAFGGALLATAFILFVSRYVRHMGSLLVAGMMIGYICSAVTDFLITFADDAEIVNLHGWSQGSFSGASWESVKMAAVIITLAMTAVFLMSKQIDAFRLGAAYAGSVGVNIGRCKVLLILFSSILSACVTAYAGPVSFIGIAVPYLVRMLLRSSRPRLLIPASFLGGAVFCLFSDLIARTVFSPTELNISTVTSMFGAPIVIVMLIRSRGGMRR